MNLSINQSHDWWRRSISTGLSDDDNDSSEGYDLKFKKNKQQKAQINKLNEK